MDSITQAVLGATVQAALLGRWQGRKALLYGAVLGSVPDLDVVIDYGDAVAEMTYHRGFSHSIFVLSALAAVLAWVSRRWRPDPRYSGMRLFVTLWLVLITHPLLDSFTSYGTQLFWPFPITPTAWSSVFIIDPFYTLPLLITVVVAAFAGLQGRVGRWPAIALGLSSAYLAFSLAGKVMVERRLEPVMAERGLAEAQLFSSPTPFNTLLWRAVIVDGDDYYESLIGWFDGEPPELVRLPRGAALAALLEDSPQHARLAWFTNGVLRYDVIGDDLVVTDLRLGITGFHPFRFALARREAGQWQPIRHTELEPAQRGDLGRLQQLWRRLWHPAERVALEQWAAGINQP